MHVGFVTSSYPDDALHPRGVFIHRLARGLVDEDVQVTVVAPGSDVAPASEVRDGVTIRRYRYWLPGRQRLTRTLAGIEPTLRASPHLAVQVPVLLARLAQGASELASTCDLIHAHWLFPSGLAAVATRVPSRTPLVITSHGGDLNLARRSAPFRWLSRGVGRRADLCVGVSARDCALLRDLIGEAVKVEFLPVGVEDQDAVQDGTTGPLKSDVLAREFCSLDGLKLLYVGSLVPRKAVGVLLEAIAITQAKGLTVGCAVLGDGPERDALESTSDSLGLKHVWFAGSRPPGAVTSWMRAADLLILPSRGEPWGSVVPEAMAQQTPPVVCQTAGSASLVENGRSGFTIPEDDPTALADSLLSFARLAERDREEMRSAARRKVVDAGLLVRQVATRYRDLYCSLLQARESSGSLE